MFCSKHSKNIKERNRNSNDASLSTTLLSMSILTQLVRVRFPFNAIWRKKESDNLEISPKRQTPSVGSYSVLISINKDIILLFTFILTLT